MGIFDSFRYLSKDVIRNSILSLDSPKFYFVLDLVDHKGASA